MKNNIPPGIGLFLVFLFFTFVGHTKGIDTELNKEIQNRVEHLNSVIDIQYNNKVREKINLLINTNRRVSETMLGRSSIYFPLIEGVLRERNLPEDLKYLPVIESGLNPHAVSRVRATGLWQFMKPTAKYVGLKITRSVDERKDPIKSTYAALDYLEKLHKQFGDWTLALAAYNCGPGNVRKAIRKAGGSKDYWTIQKFLPRETRNYIPKAIAMHYVMKYYYAHDIKPAQIDDDLKFTASVKVFEKIELKEIAKRYELDFEVIKDLNPSFLKNFIPQSNGKHYLTLPENHLYDYVDKSNLHDHLFHVKSLNKVEKIKDPILIRKNILAATKKQSELSKLETKDAKALISITPQRFKFIRLGNRQSLMDISKSYNIDLEKLMRINNIDESNPPKQGDLIKIYE